MRKAKVARLKCSCVYALVQRVRETELRDCRLTTAAVETRQLRAVGSIFSIHRSGPSTRGSTKSYLVRVDPPTPEKPSLCRKQFARLFAQIQLRQARLYNDDIYIRTPCT